MTTDWVPLTLTVDDPRNAVHWNAVRTTSSPTGDAYWNPVRTRKDQLVDALQQRLYEEQQVGDRIAKERTELRGELRTWQTAYWILSCLFLIMFIAALWGWLR